MLRVFMMLLLGMLLVACASQNDVDIEQVNGKALDKDAMVNNKPRLVMTDKDRKTLQTLLTNMVIIPAGDFQMGDIRGDGEDDELPVRTVSINSFAISRYEVTFEQYDLFTRMTDSFSPKDRWGRGQRPVIDISWYEVTEFINWVSEQTGVQLRLLSEAEWEYAARAASDKRYSHGDSDALLCTYANIADSATTIGWRNKKCNDGFATTAPVGTFKPNPFGLYDMHGNVWEWVSDCWKDNYKKAPINGQPNKKGDCDKRVQRGGSWFYGSEEARVSYRSSGGINERSVTVGFRLARDI